MSKLIAMMIEGERSVHAAGACGGNYATLCGQSSDDDPECGREVPLRYEEKINCQACISIIHAAKKYRETDLKGGRTK